MKQYKRGFTLIELIVALAIFSIVVLVATSIFVMTLRGYRKVYAAQNTQENARYILETMMKEIKTSEIKTGEGSPLTDLFIHYPSYGLIGYKIESGQIKRVTLLEGIQVLNSSQVEITGFFDVQGNGSSEQKRVTIIMKAKAKGLRPEEQAEINLQTTISQRPAEILD